eukprot:2727667-Amphidinium_carterae.1
MVAYTGGAISESTLQLDPESNRAKSRKRPYPLGPAFHNVMEFPAPDLWGFIETTSYYIVQSGRRFDFEQRVQHTFGDKAEFMDASSDLYPFYSACLRFHVKHNPPPVLPTDLDDDVEIITGPQYSPQQKKRKLDNGAPDLRTAVSDVYARRRKAGINEHIPYHEVVNEAMQDSVPLQPGKVEPFIQPSRSLTPKQKAMPRPKVVLSPACLRGVQQSSVSAQSGQHLPDETGSSLLWQKFIHPWTSSPRSQGGVMKIPAPLHYGLGEFANNAVKALMVLLKTRVISVARRALDPYIRVRYVRDLAGYIHPRALTLCQTLEEFRMFYTVLNDLASNIVTYDYHEFLIKAEGGFHLLFNRSYECRQAITSALSSALILALRSTLHELESRRTEIGNLLTEFLQQTPIQVDERHCLLVPHRIEWKGGSISIGGVVPGDSSVSLVSLALNLCWSMRELVLLKTIYVMKLLLHLPDPLLRSAGKPQFQCCGCSSTTGLARCQYCLHTACKYHMFYIPALNGGDLACVHCRTIEIDPVRPCQCYHGQ